MGRKTVTLGARLRYAFENTLSKGPIAMIGWLALFSLAIILVAAALMQLLHVGYGENSSFLENFWNSLMRTFDAGNMADDGAGEGAEPANWVVRGIALAVTLGGIFVISTLIGTLTSGIESKLDDLRKGRSRVLESGHTLILGWSPKVYTIISELLIANRNQRKASIVILAERDKVEMEDDIATRFPSTGNTRIICRTGSSLDLDELEIANPHEARSIIILAPEGPQPDIFVIKSILALTNNPNRKPEPYQIVAEIHENANMEAARLVGGDEAVLIQPGDLIARVIAQTCRQSGLSAVYTELLDFDGAEIYYSEQPGLTGKSYRDALSAFTTSTVMGIFRGNGAVLINPPMDTVIGAGDKIIAISEDDDTVKMADGPPPAVDHSAIRSGNPAPSAPENTIILGCSDLAEIIIRELDNYVPAGSRVTVVAPNPDSADRFHHLTGSLERLALSHQVGNTTERAVLDGLEIPSYDHIILLCSSGLDVQEADARTLITLLHLRNIAEETGRDLNIVSEMLDPRNQALAEVARADDFIVSDKLVSLMLAQLSENKHLHMVFEDLFREEGSEIYLKPVTDYVATGVSVDFHTVLHAAAARGETAIGYRIAAQSTDPRKGYGVNCNPNKAERITFAQGDKLIVLAEQ